MSVIYSILNKKNGKIYVGQTRNSPKDRFSKHKFELNTHTHPNNHLQNAWDKYGEDSFEFNILENCSTSSLNSNEIFWIDYFNSTDPEKGYNLHGGGNVNFTVSDETRKKLSDINKGKNHWNYGRHHSSETREKISESMKLVENPMHNDETCKKMSESRIKKYNTTGYYRVSKHKKSDCKQGFYWRYQWRENGKRKTINSVDLDKLKEKVLANGLEWKSLDDEDSI